MINLLELVGFLATIARLGATTHGLHHGHVELGRSVGCAAVTRFSTRATGEGAAVVVDA